MKRIKTRLRSQLSNVTLNHCMRISMEAPAFDTFDFDTAVNSWSALKKHKCITVIFFLLYYISTSISHCNVYMSCACLRKAKPGVSVFLELLTAVSYDTTY